MSDFQHCQPAVTPPACPVDRLLPRLDKVRAIRPGQWLARCPAHDDRHPSLSIREAGNGTLLLKCWSGCSVTEIVTAVGLQQRDLFPQTGKVLRQSGPSRKAIEHERLVLLIGKAQLAQGAVLSPEDQSRLEKALHRLEVLESRR